MRDFSRNFLSARRVRGGDQTTMRRVLTPIIHERVVMRVYPSVETLADDDLEVAGADQVTGDRGGFLHGFTLLRFGMKFIPHFLI